MKRFLGLVALFVGAVMCASAQVNDTIQRGCGQRPISGDYTEVTLPADGDSPRGTGDVCQDGAYHLPLGGAVRGFGKQLIIAGKADGAENVIRVKATTEGFRGNEFFRYLRGRKFLFIQCPVCA